MGGTELVVSKSGLASNSSQAGVVGAASSSDLERVGDGESCQRQKVCEVLHFE